MTLDLGTLKIGDVVILKNLAYGSFLSAEGIFVEDVVMDRDLNNITDYLFAVHLTRQYSAAKELESFVTYNEIARDDEQADHVRKYLRALEVTTLFLQRMFSHDTF